MSFEDVKAKLAQGRKPGYKRLSGRGCTNLHSNEDGSIALKYHNTDVVTFAPGFVELNSGGWLTPTTKERMNRGLAMAGLGFSNVYQDKKIWYVKDAEFFDGIRLDYAGNVLNARPKTPPQNLRKVSRELLDVNDWRLTEMLKEHKPEAQAITRKLITRWIAELSKQIDAGTFNTDSAGACWFCGLRTQDNEPLGEAMHDIDHLVVHLKECGGFSIPLLVNALQSRCYRYPAIFLAKKEGSEIKPDIETMRQYKDTIMRAARQYFENKLLTRLTDPMEH